MNWKGALYMLIVLLTWTACKTPEAAIGKLKRKPAKVLVDRLEAQTIDFEWFSSRNRIYLETGERSQTFSAKIRMRRDSVIWITASKLNVEASRILITPDSIHIINRLDKEYYARDFRFLEQELGLTVDFNTLQQLIIGNALFVDKKKLKSDVDTPYYRLRKETTDLQSTYWLSPQNYLLMRMQFEDQSAEQTMELDYDKYKKISDKDYFAHDRNIAVNSPTTGVAQARITFSSLEFEEKKMPFRVSPRYARR